MRFYKTRIPAYLLIIYILVFLLYNLYYILININNRNRSKCLKFSRYSSYTCSGPMNAMQEWRKRTCRFHNICYNKTTEKFEYFIRNNRSSTSFFFDADKEHQHSFPIDGHGFVNLVARSTYTESWAPTLINQPIPSDATFLKPSIHVLFMHYHNGFEHFHPGYFIWEDLASLYTSMMRMNVYNPKAILMEYRNFPPNNSQHYQMYEEIVPAFADRVVSIDEYVSNYQCFRTLVVGGSAPVFGLDAEMYNHGKEVMLYEFRSRILRYHNIDLQNPPTSHHIVLVSNSELYRNSKRSIYNFDKVVNYLQITYSSIRLTIVEWEKMKTLKEQLKLIYSTTILITLSDGVSVLTPFLPRNAHAIIMDYNVSEETNDYKKFGESVWNYFPHVKKLYYQIQYKTVYKSNLPNVHHDVSVIIDVNRLKNLVDIALENSS